MRDHVTNPIWISLHYPESGCSFVFVVSFCVTLAFDVACGFIGGTLASTGITPGSVPAPAAETPPAASAPPKVKLSLRDFVLKKKRQKEEMKAEMKGVRGDGKEEDGKGQEKTKEKTKEQTVEEEGERREMGSEMRRTWRWRLLLHFLQLHHLR
jgi:hypothetical protein